MGVTSSSTGMGAGGGGGAIRGSLRLDESNFGFLCDFGESVVD